MVAGRQGACAQNNALWCDAVLRAAGAKTEFQSGYWHAAGEVLPLYPNIVTCSQKPSTDLKTALAALPAGAAVKDSFDCLGLASMGFRKLLSGTWLFRPPQTFRKPPLQSDWHKAKHPEALKKWLNGWNSNDSLHAVFPPQLLDLNTVDFATVSKGETIRAGAVFNRGPKLGGKEIVGLSNLFCRRSWRYAAMHDLLEPFANKPVCTYETDEELLPVYRQLGFEECGKLSVWLKA